MVSWVAKLGKAAKLTALQLIIVFVFLEISLRLFPFVISPAWLVHFNSDIRSEVSDKLGFAKKDDDFLLKRTDGGRPINLLPPKQAVHVRADQIDIAQGAVENIITDQFGFCNPHKLENSVADILAVGDSFTWCTTIPADAAWPARLGKRNGNKVYNAGLSGVGFYEYLEIARHMLLHTRPSKLIVAIYGGNDLLNAHGMKQYRDAMEAGEIDPEIAARPTIKDRSMLGKLYELVIERSPLGKYSYSVNVAGSLILSAKRQLFGSRVYQRPELVDIDFRYSVSTATGQTVAFNPLQLGPERVAWRFPAGAR